ncbi:MAG TPA: hypothetical protein VK912_16010 [Longimicrobiales bacterium]|nr:hypothetical protein [Longimicrobiales bacterium]
MAEAKGATLLATLDFVRRRADAGTALRALAVLGAADRAAVEAVTPTDTIDLELLFELWRAVDSVLKAEMPDWAEQAGAYSIESVGMQLYGGIVRKATPREFLSQPVKLFRLFYHTGDMRIVDEGPDGAVLRLTDLEVTEPIFCRRQTGGLRAALALAGADDATVRHVRCAFEGDAFCEWQLQWRLPEPVSSDV